jgi:hypothetical protein
MKHLKKFIQYEAIGFRTPNDNRDEDNEPQRIKLGYTKSKEFTNKVESIITKLQAMAERGDEFERDVAATKLKEIARKYNINVNNINSSNNGKIGFRVSWDNIEDEIEELDKEAKLLD